MCCWPHWWACHVIYWHFCHHHHILVKSWSWPNTWTMREVCVCVCLYGSCGHDLTGRWREVSVTCWHHIDRKQITDWSCFSSPRSSKAGSQTDKQEWPQTMNCRIYEERSHTEHTHVCTQPYTRCMADQGLRAWLWNMIYDQRNACTVFFCAQSTKWAYCFTICRKKKKKHTLGRFAIMNDIYHISHKMFSHQKKLDGDKGPHSLFAVGVLSAELQHRCLDITMHTGTHLDNSRINQREAPGKLRQ